MGIVSGSRVKFHYLTITRPILPTNRIHLTESIPLVSTGGRTIVFVNIRTARATHVDDQVYLNTRTIKRSNVGQAAVLSQSS